MKVIWYSAHIILYTRFKDGIQDQYPVWENVILVEAETAKEAFEKAWRKGCEEANEDQGYTYDGRPAEWVFVGIRKVKECLENFDPHERQSGGIEEYGTEITFSELTVKSEADLDKLVRGEAVTVVYEK